MGRRQNFQTISWFWDLFERSRLNLDPPYQRRSVWNQRYKDEFIDTILLGYPAPAIFLFEEIEPSGVTRYNVVDGKQRLTTIFEFAKGRFPVAEDSKLEAARGKYFEHLEREQKTAFWGYPFSVEYLPDVDQTILNDIFHRINKNVAKLTAQELRHARYSGLFITHCETLAEWLNKESPEFPRIVAQSRRQMKDVELVAQLLLLLEAKEPRGYSPDELDLAFSTRDEEWTEQNAVDSEFRAVVSFIGAMLKSEYGDTLRGSRLRNQLDYYSLFGAVAELNRSNSLPAADRAALELRDFVNAVEDEEQRKANPDAQKYYEAARSAANDTGPRKARTQIMEALLRSAS